MQTHTPTKKALLEDENMGRKTTTILTLLTLALIAISSVPAIAERGDDSKRKSKNGHIEGTIDGVTVTLDYGRPNVKGRKVWGGLVPYGKVWRTGADEATTITFGSDVTVQGEEIAAGTYSLFTIPGEGEWTLIFNSVADQWGAYDYEASKDVLRVTVEPGASEHVESLEFAIDGSDVVLHWAELAVPFTVAAN